MWFRQHVRYISIGAGHSADGEGDLIRCHNHKELGIDINEN